MGEVYRARDTKLGRDVAIKVLPSSLIGDPDRLLRFTREAQALAALNHPNIAAIHHVEETADGPAIVMELVDGETLADRIARGPVPVDEAVAIAKQIAEALEAAHEQGIIHRDLKPANIKVRPEGTVKVLDFGLAKLSESTGGEQPAAGSAPLTMSPTITSPAMATGAGVLLGTAAYMSPEQAKGRVADKRSDIWAFGCVLYEMLTGQRAFDGEDITESLAAVVRGEPDWSKLPGSTPAAVRTLLRRCLVKQANRRWRDIGDARFDLEADATGSPIALPARSSRRVWMIGAITAAAGMAAGVGVMLPFARPVVPAVAPSAFTIDTLEDRAVATGPNETPLAIAPDGRFIVYSSSAFGQTFSPRTLMIRRLDAFDAEPLIPALSALQPRSPFVSPDSRWVGFISGRSIVKVPATGGTPVTVCECNVQTRGSAAWLADDTIVYSSGRGLRAVSANGGGDRSLTTVDAGRQEADHVGPAALPGSRFIVFAVIGDIASRSAIQVLNLDTGARRTIVSGAQFARYVSPGYLAYLDSFSMVRAIGFDASRGETRGDPISLGDVAVNGSGVNAAFDLSRTGTLVYLPGGQANADHLLAWVSRDGREQPIDVPPHGYLYPRFSPDGAFVALDVREPRSNDLWLFDLRRETLSKLTADGSRNSYPVWTPNGRDLLYVSNQKGSDNIYRRRADGSGTAEALSDHRNAVLPYAISPDGTAAVLRELTSGVDLALLRLDGTRRVEPLIHSVASELNADLSPDGRWIVYQSDQSGTAEIYVQPFPDVSGGRWQISNAGGLTPLWARNGREIFYVGADNNLMRVEIAPGTSFSAGRPSRFFPGTYSSMDWYRGQGGRAFDLSPDGSRFIVVKDRPRVDSQRPTGMHVVLNWHETLKQNERGAP
jgi:serine/threonine-protein kinase